jgi:maltose O-acetyltransferase
MMGLLSKLSYIIECLTDYITNELVGSIPSHSFRRAFYKNVNKVKIGKDSSISLHCRLRMPNKIRIGDNVAINQGVYLDGRGGLTIGNNVNIGRNVSIYTASHDYNSPGFDYIEKSVLIGSKAWIASNALILPGVKIGEGAVVAAGAVVTKDVEAYNVVGGNPAKFIKKRNRNLTYKTNYFRLFY